MRAATRGRIFEPAVPISHDQPKLLLHPFKLLHLLSYVLKFPLRKIADVTAGRALVIANAQNSGQFFNRKSNR